MLALNASAYTIPSLVGPVLAGLIAENLTWRWVFAVLVPLAPLAGFLVRGPLTRLDRATSDPGDAAPPTDNGMLLRALQGGVALSVGLGAMLVAPNLALRWALVALAIGLPSAFLGVRQILPAGTLTMRQGLPANVLFAAALSMAFFTADLFVPLALVSARGISATLAGVVLTVGIIGWTAGAYVPDRLLKAGVAKGPIVRSGAVLVLVGLLVLGGVILADVSILVAVGGWILAGLGAGMGFTTNSIAVLDDAAGGVGRASTQMELGNQAGIAVGTDLAGALVGAAGATAAASPQSLPWPRPVRCSHS